MKKRFLSAPIFSAALLLCIPLFIHLFFFLSAAWIGLDDPYYVINNQQVLAGLSIESIGWAFSTIYYGNWMPLTWISYQFDASIWKLNPLGYHLTNCILDYCNSLMLFVLLFRATSKPYPAIICALLFSLHPIHTEPVAWISSRKDLLVAFFELATLIAYLRYSKTLDRKNYALLIICFFLSLLSKPSAIPLPLVMLVLDYWPLRRFETLSIKTLFIEKLPLFILGGAVLIINVSGQSAPGVDLSSGYLDPVQRVLNSIRFLSTYFTRGLFPINLAIEYPHPLNSPFSLLDYFSTALFSVSFVVAIYLRKRAAWLIGGLCWFLFSISLNLQLMQIGNQGTADRHMYLAVAGITILLGWTLYNLIHHRIAQILLISILLFFASQSIYLSSIWSKEITIFSHAARLYPNSGNAWMYLGDTYARNNNFKFAKSSYISALQAEPEKVLAYRRLDQLSKRNKISAEHLDWIFFENSSKENLSYSKLVARSFIYSIAALASPNCEVEGLSCLEHSKEYFQLASNLNPKHPQTAQANHQLAVGYYKTGDWRSSLVFIERFIKLDPKRIDARLLKIHCLIEMSRLNEAKQSLDELGLEKLNAHERNQFEALSKLLNSN